MNTILIPRQYKWIGLAVFLLSFVGLIVIGMLYPETWEQSEPRRKIASVLMLIGLLLLVLSKERVEDEFINDCRLRAFRTAFLAGIIYFILDSADLLQGAVIKSSFGLLIFEIGIYLIMFYISKTGLKNGEQS